MSQSDFVTQSNDGAGVKGELDAADQALATNNAGNADPATPFQCQWIARTDLDILYQRNDANNAKVKRGPLNVDWKTPIQDLVSTTTALDSTTTVIPADDTPPQNNEGKEFLTQAITPTDAGNIIVVEVALVLSHSVAGTEILALFKDTGVDALAAVPETMSAVNEARTLRLFYKESAGSTTARTYKARAGNSAAGTTYLNGVNNVRLFGGVCISYIRVMEYQG